MGGNRAVGHHQAAPIWASSLTVAAELGRRAGDRGCVRLAIAARSVRLCPLIRDRRPMTCWPRWWHRCARSWRMP